MVKKADLKKLKYRRQLARNLELYASLFLKIRTKSGTIAPFIFNSAQQHLHKKLQHQKRLTGKVRAIILKGRQQGCSTYIGGRYYHISTHHHGFRTYIMTHENEATINLFDMVTRYHENMHLDFRPRTGASNRKELLFDSLDSGYRVGTAGTKGTGRSSTIQLFHGSEVAFWPHAESHAGGVLQAISKEPGTEVILESTANGLGNYYHQQWCEAVAGTSEYIAIFIPWYWQKEYASEPTEDFELNEEEMIYRDLYSLTLRQMHWRRNKIIELKDPLLFKQEYPATASEAFQTTGVESFIRTESVLNARKQPQYRSYGAVVAGFDPARDGEDRDAWIYRQGLNAFGLEYSEMKDFPSKCAYCLRKLKGAPYIDMLFLDYGGGGWEIAGVLRDAGFGDRIMVVNFGSAADYTDAYYNKRAEMYGLMRDWLYDKNETPSIPDDDALHADIVAPTYSYDIRSRIKLERKADIKKRGLKSPDGGDALAMTFAYQIERSRVTTGTEKTDRCNTKYDIFGDI